MKHLGVWDAPFAAVCLVATFAISPVNAGAVVLPFPGTGTTYTSAANGSKLIPPGGESAALFTAGDNVEQIFLGTGVASVNSLKVAFGVNDFLHGASEEVLISINGTSVVSFDVPNNGGAGGLLTVSGSVFFSPIVGNGTYDLAMTLSDTVPEGDGGIAFEDGGSFALNGGVRVVGVPEPTTFGVVCTGLAALVGRRRKRPRIA